MQVLTEVEVGTIRGMEEKIHEISEMTIAGKIIIKDTKMIERKTREEKIKTINKEIQGR